MQTQVHQQCVCSQTYLPIASGSFNFLPFSTIYLPSYTAPKYYFNAVLLKQTNKFFQKSDKKEEKMNEKGNYKEASNKP